MALDLFDFKPYPNLVSWLARMRELPGHDETHEDMLGLKSIVEQAKENRARQMSAKI